MKTIIGLLALAFIFSISGSYAQPDITPVRVGNCLETKLTVNIKLRYSNNQNTFKTIDAALKSAETRNLCRIRVAILPGSFADDLYISRPTTLVGSTGSTRTIIRGSVTGISGMSLNVSNITFDMIQGIALKQTAGNLTLKDVSFTRTQRDLSDEKSGTALDLSGKIVARLENVTFTANKGPAIAMSGRYAKLHGKAITITNSEIHPDNISDIINRNLPFSYVGAIYLANESSAYLNGLSIANAQGFGVFARGGARVHIRSSVLSSTFPIVTSNGSKYVGANVYAIDNAIVEMHVFENKNGTVGFWAQRAYFKTSNGTVHHNIIGLGSSELPSDPNYDIVYCMSGSGDVRWYDNDTTLSLPYVPIPTSPGEDQPEYNCPGVAWVN